mgnify:CR=1 FL=1
MDMKSHRIAYDLEEPTPIMFWSPTEFVLAITFVTLGMVGNMVIVGFAMATAVLVGARYLKRGAKRGAMQHCLYALGLQLDNNLAKKFPKSWENDFVE